MSRVQASMAGGDNGVVCASVTKKVFSSTFPKHHGPQEKESLTGKGFQCSNYDFS